MDNRNPFEKTFSIDNFDESEFIDKEELKTELVSRLGFEPYQSDGLTFYRRENELGGYDYLPFAVRFWPGSMPDIDPEVDRWLEGYDRGVVLFTMNGVRNRQHVAL